MDVTVTQSEHLVGVANTVSDSLAEREDVQAVLLVGSATTGHADEFSDIDLKVVGPDEPGQRSVDGVHVEWNPITAREIEAKLEDWEDDAALYTYANGELLYDQINLADRLGSLDGYPPEIRREKLYTGWFYGTGSVFDARKAAKRGDARVTRCAAASAVEQFASLTYVLDNQFPPYQKWLFRALPRELPGVDAALAGDVEALETMTSRLKPELQDELDDDRIENPYLYQPEFRPLG